MDLGRIMPLACIICAITFGALIYVTLVMSYRRQHESDIEQKQRERQKMRPTPPPPAESDPRED